MSELTALKVKKEAVSWRGVGAHSLTEFSAAVGSTTTESVGNFGPPTATPQVDAGAAAPEEVGAGTPDVCCGAAVEEEKNNSLLAGFLGLGALVMELVAGGVDILPT